MTVRFCPRAQYEFANIVLLSTPGRRVRQNRTVGASYLTLTRLILATRRDFLRAAVFFFMTPRFIALSIALYADGRSFSASAKSLAESALVIIFVVSERALRRRILKTRFLVEERIAFFAELVIAI